VTLHQPVRIRRRKVLASGGEGGEPIASAQGLLREEKAEMGGAALGAQRALDGRGRGGAVEGWRRQKSALFFLMATAYARAEPSATDAGWADTEPPTRPGLGIRVLTRWRQKEREPVVRAAGIRSRESMMSRLG